MERSAYLQNTPLKIRCTAGSSARGMTIDYPDCHEDDRDVLCPVARVFNSDERLIFVVPLK